MASDKFDLIQSVRRGDLVRVRYLIEHKEVELNIRDQWDSTPLYYACLCGHLEIAQYLLDNGARCQANTFDGERCRYGALTDTIRTLLKNYNVLTARTTRRNTYDEFLRKLFEQGLYSDVTFVVDERTFPLHRCVLAARSSFFREALESRWHNKRYVNLTKAKFNAESFEAIIRYLYTNCCEIALEYIDSVKALAKSCRLPHLIDLIERKKHEIDEWQASKTARSNIYRLVLEPDEDDDSVRLDFRMLAEQAIPLELRQWIAGSEMPFIDQPHLDIFSDLEFIIDECYHFNVHQAFMCTRTEYFSAMVKNHFNEMLPNSNKQTNEKSTMILKHIRKELFLPLLYYIYSDECEISNDCVDELLILADELLLPGLKRLCGNTYSKLLNVDTIISTIRISRLFELIKLEDQCIRFISDHLEDVLQQEDFVKFVLEDAASVVNRQETDSVPIIDDLRFYLAEFSTVNQSDIDETSEKMKLLDNFLEKIGLDI
ncbi:unnamed protein product [Adineta steineri]|uniref:BTB domain-containing protein n=1 Tax=Adineta steineri TaxID=433720 RepID=A0A813QF83_9BILA|nr:unnamed protein product [Adineta steineri]CAF0766238.1 unnamed protein product [Adineta steineri]CAF0923504.1 unnamed protein product [Adineta steineri]